MVSKTKRSRKNVPSELPVDENVTVPTEDESDTTFIPTACKKWSLNTDRSTEKNFWWNETYKHSVWSNHLPLAISHRDSNLQATTDEIVWKAFLQLTHYNAFKECCVCRGTEYRSTDEISSEELYTGMKRGSSHDGCGSQPSDKSKNDESEESSDLLPPFFLQCPTVRVMYLCAYCFLCVHYKCSRDETLEERLFFRMRIGCTSDRPERENSYEHLLRVCFTCINAGRARPSTLSESGTLEQRVEDPSTRDGYIAPLEKSENQTGRRVDWTAENPSSQVLTPRPSHTTHIGQILWRIRLLAPELPRSVRQQIKRIGADYEHHVAVSSGCPSAHSDDESREAHMQALASRALCEAQSALMEYFQPAHSRALLKKKKIATKANGIGVVALEVIPAWTCVGVYPGYLDPFCGDQCHRGTRVAPIYTLLDMNCADHNNRVFPEFVPCFTPYINEPSPGEQSNCGWIQEPHIVKGRLSVLTVRDIQASEELLIGYGPSYPRQYAYAYDSWAFHISEEKKEPGSHVLHVLHDGSRISSQSDCACYALCSCSEKISDSEEPLVSDSPESCSQSAVFELWHWLEIDEGTGKKVANVSWNPVTKQYSLV